MCLIFVLFQFQTELRKILVSLIEVAQKLLALNPDAVELFKKANGESHIPLQVNINNPTQSGTRQNNVASYTKVMYFHWL